MPVGAHKKILRLGTFWRFITHTYIQGASPGKNDLAWKYEIKGVPASPQIVEIG
jgi:hypothetical protein